MELIKGEQTISLIYFKHSIHPTQARKWKDQLSDNINSVFNNSANNPIKEKDKLIEELYKQIGQLKVELDWLKKKLTKPLLEKKLLVEPQQLNISIVKQCGLLGINRSSFYYQPKPESNKNIPLMDKIDKIYTDCPYYGAIKITTELNRIKQRRAWRQSQKNRKINGNNGYSSHSSPKKH